MAPSSHQAPASTTPQSQSNNNTKSTQLASFLQKESDDLLSEINTLQSHLASLGKPLAIELRQFKSTIQSELKTIRKLSEQATAAVAEDERIKEEEAQVLKNAGVEVVNDDDDEEREGGDGGGDDVGVGMAELKVLHSLRSSNSPFYTAVWIVATRECTGLVAINKRFYYVEPKKDRKRGGGTPPVDEEQLSSDLGKLGIEDKNADGVSTQRKSVLVDIVADNSEEWIKVSTVTPSRLLFELAKQGWDWDSEDEDDNGSDNDARSMRDYGSDDEDGMIELVKLAVEMKKAASMARIRYRCPRIRFVLPKIEEGRVREIDRIIRDIRRVGVTVQCGSLPPPRSNGEDNGTSSITSLLPSLVPSAHPHATSTLNVDCTLLLALVSDLSHHRDISHSPTYHPAVNRQIDFEAERPLVPSELWPVMHNRSLVCTGEASKRMHEIVEIIGTEKEKTRTRLLMGETEENLDRDALVARFQELSEYQVPLDWKLPIQTIDAGKEIQRGWDEKRLPPLARLAGDQLSDINRSVFLYGWATDLMTITSNRTVAKQIEALVEENRNGDDNVRGPNVWVCDTARSLIGKDSSRRKQ